MKLDNAAKAVELFSGRNEFQEAVVLLCVKYGGRLYFAGGGELDVERQLIADFASRNVRVAFEHAKEHTIEVCKTLGLPLPHPLMICEGFAP
jgi:hypothetical protein